MENDPWLTACERMARNAARRAKLHAPLPDGKWDLWCLEMERRGEFLSYVYFPRPSGTLTFSLKRRLTGEAAEQAAWRQASNRMKRAIDLFQVKANMVADAWGRWSTNRGMNQAEFRVKEG